ncbi:MAG: DUF1553 domain-containing protein [Pedosphaera sp.]|nr:DUF1553 domain-containing protein [Pedosphaera sp.]
MTLHLVSFVHALAFVRGCHRFLICLALLKGVWGNAGTETAKHWAFQPIVRPALPAGNSTNAIDRFVLARLLKSGGPVFSEANRRTLVRRLSFNLRGLPPSPAEVSEFLADVAQDAYERLVERFLASPQYGERWGRHWLDIVGYADSNGYFNADTDRPLAWKYRDYVVRSIAADKPVNRFITEQIAGDELAGYIAGGDVTPEMTEALIATHFWRNAPDGSGESDGNPLEVKVDNYAVLEGNVHLLGSAFLGLTLQCARCHDHKFEPLTQDDYYALQAIIRPVFDPSRWIKPDERVIEAGTRAARDGNHKLTAEVERDLKTLNASLEGLIGPFRRQMIEENLAKFVEPFRKDLLKAIDTKEKDRTELMKSLLKTNATLVDLSEDTVFKRFPTAATAAQPLKVELQSRQAAKPVPLERISATFESTNSPPAHHLLVRGNHASEGKEVAPGLPLALRGTALPGEGPASLASTISSGRRLSLARWLTSAENPVVARVLVNRVWHYHFGRGIVSTIENLGQAGAKPANPGLLDWLASEFVRSGWSLKHLHRLIVTSAAYRQASQETSGERESSIAVPGTDSLNTPPLNSVSAGLRRLDAESLRDAMLAVTGELDLKQGGPYVPTKVDGEGQIIIDEALPGAHRRSVYLQQRRTHPVDFLATFDGPAHNPVCVQRVPSTVAQQSLSLLNSEFIRTRARAFAKRLLSGTSTDSIKDVAQSEEHSLIENAFDIAYNRPPGQEELAAAESFLRAQAAVYPDHKTPREQVWSDFCQMLLASNAFMYVD